MPRYDFHCTACDDVFEATVPFETDGLPPCPRCGKKNAEKVITPPMGIHFRGSGFYKTDSRTVEKAPSPEKDQSLVTPKEKTAKAPERPSPLPSPSGRGNITQESPKKEKKGV